MIGNAIKFTTVGFVSVNITDIEGDGQTLVVDFKITDSGIGISKAKQEQLLDPFKSKLPRTQRQYQATLGLTIAGQLLKLHGSKLKITSSEGKGSSFNFAILYPLAKMQHILIHPLISPPDSRLDNLRVLCVDDEKLNLLVVKKILAKWNVMTDEAINGKMAVDMCMSKQYDVILMDINMPVMDGFEASKIIKGLKKPGYNPPRIIALTASVGAAKEEVMKFPSIDDCVLKPFKPQELKGKLYQSYVAYSGKNGRPEAGPIL